MMLSPILYWLLEVLMMSLMLGRQSVKVLCSILLPSCSHAPTEMYQPDKNKEPHMTLEELEGEYRPSQSATSSSFGSKLRYGVLVSVSLIALIIMLTYLVRSYWNEDQDLLESVTEMVATSTSALSTAPPLTSTSSHLVDPSFPPIESGNRQDDQGKSTQKKTVTDKQTQLSYVEKAAEVKRLLAITAPTSLPLPELEGSDDLFRKQWARLWSGTDVANGTKTEQLVRKATVLLDNFAQGKIVRNSLSTLTLKSPFVVDLVQPETNEQDSVDVFQLNPKSYQRYSPIVTAITAVETHQIIRFYRQFRPLLQQAYKELGYPAGGIDDVVLTTLQKIQTAPIVEGEIRLIQPKVMYEFQNQNLEQRSALDKQLIRMGPANTRLLQQKARELELVLSQVLK